MDSFIKKVLAMTDEEFTAQNVLPTPKEEPTNKELKQLDEAIKQYMGRRFAVNIFRVLMSSFS